MRPNQPLLPKLTAGPGAQMKPMKPLGSREPEVLYWIWLSELKGVGIKAKLHLLRHFSSPKNLWSAAGLDLPPLSQIQDRQSRMFVSEWKTLKDMDPAKRLLELNEKLGIQLWTLDLLDHSLESRSSEDLFLVVYVMGEPSTGPSAAVVGTRQASGDGYHAAELVCLDLIKRGSCINSGLALGIDSFAHRFALAEGGRTQGFVAHGLDQCYPNTHYALMRSLSEQGAVISPFPLGTEPYKANFIRRNALMSLWSEDVIVIEAGPQSGALNTAEHALRQGKRLWAVTGRPGSTLRAGNQQLLDQGLAAAYPLDIKQDAENPVLTLLRGAPMSTQALAEALDLPLTHLEHDLLEHENHLKIAYLPDGRWHYRGW